jgi:hypothetical protein
VYLINHWKVPKKVNPDVSSYYVIVEWFVQPLKISVDVGESVLGFEG